MTNYFMIYRPFHFEYAKKIIGSHLQTDSNILVNHYNAEYVFDAADTGNRIVNLPVKMYERALAIKEIKKELLSLAKAGKQMNVFIPHTLGILSNYAYFTLAASYGNVRVNVFYEGIIVFYKYDHHYFKNFGYYLSRWMVSFLSGIPYKVDKRLLDFNDSRVHKIYSPFLNLDAPRQKIVKTDLEQVDFVPREDTCVILGLKLENKFQEELKKIITAMYARLTELNVKRIFFKDHPSEKCELFQSLARELGKELFIIEDTSPIENIIVNYSPKYIFSIWSSGIINLSNILPGSTEIHCFVTEKIITGELKKIIEAFKQQNIKVTYV
jgi:hypothetical protein